MDTYKNILANKWMRDTNYIIIKDTDDLEELEREYELFQSQMTVRQQRLSDDRSIEIWNMTNKEHYESLKAELMKDIDDKLGGQDNQDTYSYEYQDDELVNDEEITNILNTGWDEEEQSEDEDLDDPDSPIKEETTIPIETDTKPTNKTSLFGKALTDKEKQADQYEIDTNINIVGSIKGTSHEEYISNLEKAWTNFNSQSHDHRKKSDDKCRELFGMSNLDRYNDLKAKALQYLQVRDDKKVEVKDDGKGLEITHDDSKLEFVQYVYNNMQAINESEKVHKPKRTRLNDTPYFTPQELIDMGVHGNHNWYSPEPDNDGLITNVKVPLWFDSYKDMCMDHIFEDYRKDWIKTIEMLYSDFEDIKESGDEAKINARKQSILDLGWNPEIPFTRENRKKATKRVNKLLDETFKPNIFIDMTQDVSDDDVLEEAVTNATHKPVFLIFQQGKTPIISPGIQFFTKSAYSHAAISFDSTLNFIHTYNMNHNGKSGLVSESIKSYKDSIVSIMAFFAPNKIVESMKSRVSDFSDHKTDYDFGIIVNKVFNIDRKFTGDYKQVCSTFVDTILQSGKVDLSKDINIPDPGQLYNAAKQIPNKIVEVYYGPANKYDSKRVDKKLNSLVSKKFLGIEEATLSTEYSPGQTNILNEVKQFPIEFDKEGNLIIYKARIGTLAFGDEINDSVQLLEAYRNTNNIEGMKYELAKLWFINDQIEKRLKKRLANDEYKELIDCRAICLNVFKTNLDYVLKNEKGFNFSDYYNSTPFSDNSIKVTANTLKYTSALIKSIV